MASPDPLLHTHGDFGTLLRKRGLRLTDQRECVYQMLLKADREGRHVDAEQLHASVKALGARVALATVYRCLVQLERAGLARGFRLHSGRWIYEPTNCAPHSHLIDGDEGVVVDVHDETLMRQMRRRMQHAGFELTHFRHLMLVTKRTKAGE